jgi:hypothetical protein
MSFTGFTGTTNIQTIDQRYFVEAIQGAKHPSNYLDRFPDNIFNTSPDAVLYKLIYTLIGPAGVASLKRGYFEARLKFEEMGLESAQLESFYANPMGFGRIAEETFSEDVTGLLNNDIWSKIKSKDQAYKNRVLDFMHAARLGGTPEGMRYAAKSALGRDVNIVEGYEYIFDQNSDQIVGFQNTIEPNKNGIYSTEKFAIVPNPETSGSIVQTITFNPIPSFGTFTILYKFVSTQPIPYSATALDIKNALSQNDSIKNNIIVSGTPRTGITIQFVGPIGHNNEDVLSVDASGLASSTNATCSVTVESNSGIISTNNEFTFVSPESKKHLEIAIDKLRPINAYPVFVSGQSDWNQIAPSPESIAPISSSDYTNVVRHVTGNSQVTWPDNTKKSLDWIKPNEEIEAPILKKDFKESYQNFHEINKIYAYSEDNSDLSVVQKQLNYSTGSFNPNLLKKITYLNQFNDAKYSTTNFTPDLAVAEHFKPRTATSYDLNSDTPLIDGIYPVSYLDVPGVIKKQTNDLFWASVARSSGTDYLEIDFGKTRAINFLSFEFLKSPVSVSIWYDTYDYEGYRNFVQVSKEQLPGTTETYEFDTEFSYYPDDLSPWEYVTYNFKDSNQNIVYTRYLRIKFDRKFESSNGNFVKNWLTNNNGDSDVWPICVKNLRIGRTV